MAINGRDAKLVAVAFRCEPGESRQAYRIEWCGTGVAGVWMVLCGCGVDPKRANGRDDSLLCLKQVCTVG